MTSWRRLAIELFPERQSIYQQENESIWDVLFDLLPAAIEAHRVHNLAELQRIYKFTEWCHTQKDVNPDIWQAAYTVFYEHLVDDKITLEAIPHWVKPTVFQAMRSEFEQRLEKSGFRELVTKYNKVNGTAF